MTIPHKEAVMPHMDELTESARRIGAVNTVTKLADGRLRGDNTDWLGIKNQLVAKAPAAGALAVRSSPGSKKQAVVVVSSKKLYY